MWLKMIALLIDLYCDMVDEFLANLTSSMRQQPTLFCEVLLESFGHTVAIVWQFLLVGIDGQTLGTG